MFRRSLRFFQTSAQNAAAAAISKLIPGRGSSSRGSAAGSNSRIRQMLVRTGYIRPAAHTAHVHPVNYFVEAGTPISPLISDHEMVHFGINSFNQMSSSRRLIASWNTMMQAKRRRDSFNTAFQIVEDDDVYRDRTLAQFEFLSQQLFEDVGKEIAVIALQEATIDKNDEYIREYIKTKFPPAWRDAIYDNTRWGVCTIILQSTCPNGMVLDQSLLRGLDIKDIDVRSRTFASPADSQGSVVKFTNIHIPHDDSEEKFRIYITRIVQDAVKHGANEQMLTHNLVGDWNVEAERLRDILAEVIHVEMEKARTDNTEPFKLSANVHSNKDGHLKQSGVRLSVDSMIILAIQPDTTQHSYTIEQDPPRYNKAVATTMLAAAALFGTTAFDEPEKVDGTDTADINDDDLVKETGREFDPFKF